MKIALVSFHIEHELSGELTNMIALADLLCSGGIEAKVIRFPAGERKSNREHLLAKAINLFSLARQYAPLVKGFDLVQLHLPTAAFAFLADPFAKQIECPLVLHFENHLVDKSLSWMVRNSFIDPLFYLPRLIVNNRLFAFVRSKKYRAIVVSSHYQKQELQRIGYRENAIRVIPNIVNREALNVLEKERCREYFQVSGNQKVVGYIGHLFEVKGVRTLFKAFAELPTNYHLIVAESGLGNLSAWEREIASLGLTSRVTFAGKVNLSQYLSALDVLALPYHASFGTVVFPSLILEASAVGVPIITTNLPPLREFSNSYGGIVLVEPENPFELADGIKRLTQEPLEPLRLINEQKGARDGVFGREQLFSNYSQLYKEAVGDRAKQ